MKLVPLLIALAVAAPVAAKDVCLRDNDGRDYRLEKLKLPKKPGKMTPVLGSARIIPLETEPLGWGPLAGSAIVAIGTPELVFVALAGQTANGAGFSVRLILDGNLAGQAAVKVDSEGTFPASVSVLEIDCDASTLP